MRIDNPFALPSGIGNDAELPNGPAGMSRRHLLTDSSAVTQREADVIMSRLSASYAPVAAPATATATSAAAWPPPTHDNLLRDAFPRMDKHELRAMQVGSRQVDMAAGIAPITLLERNAPKHAMTPHYKVREFEAKGMTPDEAVKEAQAWARKDAKNYVDAQGEKAKELLRQSERATDPVQKRDLREAALFEFGKGAHTLMDNTSPAHRDFQVYKVPTKVVPTRNGQAEVYDADKFIKEELAHVADEARQPTLEESDATNKALRSYYGNVFGGEALLQVTPEAK